MYPEIKLVKLNIGRYIVVSLVLVFFSCEESTKKENRIVTTTNIIASSLNDIVKSDVEIVNLMDSETDPHSYNPSTNDYKLISSSKIVISNGLHLEGKLHESLETAHSNKQISWLQMSNGLTKENIIYEEMDVADPHIWFDVMNWYNCLEYVTKEIVKEFPEHEKTWLTRLDSMKNIYLALDNQVQNEINTIPDSLKYLVTAHDAFSYYSKAYQIEIKPLQGRNTNDEPSAKDIVELSNFITSKGIKSIFVESTVNQEFIKSIQESVASKGKNVSIGGELFSDAAGPSNTPEASYIGMITYNTKTIVEALK